MSVVHRTLRIEHHYQHALERVFAAWADGDVKRQWFTLSSHPEEVWRSDFRIGRREFFRSAPGVTPELTYSGLYQDIVPGVRIILSAVVTIGGRTSSVTVNTTQFRSTATGTRLTVVEQAAFLDGLESAESRIAGLAHQLDNLAHWLSVR